MGLYGNKLAAPSKETIVPKPFVKLITSLKVNLGEANPFLHGNEVVVTLDSRIVYLWGMFEENWMAKSWHKAISIVNKFASIIV